MPGAYEVVRRKGGRHRETDATSWGKSALIRRLFNRRPEGVREVTVGISVQAESASLVAFEGEQRGLPHVKAWEVAELASPGDLRTVLQRFVDSHELLGRGCRCVLPRNEYSVRLIERPTNVTDEELADATRWLLRDLIEFDVEDAAIEIIPVPEFSGRTRTPRIFVIAARNQAILDLAHTIDSAGLHLVGFDIAESAMLAIENRLPEAATGGALLSIDDKSSVLTLANQGQLFLARPVHIDADAVEAASRAALGGGDDNEREIMLLLAEFLLDIQRSLNFYESEYDQAPATRLGILPSSIDMSLLLPALADALQPMQIELLEFENFVSFERSPASSELPHITLALGSALAPPLPLGNTLVPDAIKTQRTGFGLLSAAQVLGSVMAVFGLYLSFLQYQFNRDQALYQTLEGQLSDAKNRIQAERNRSQGTADPSDRLEQMELLRRQRDSALATLRDVSQKENVIAGPRFSSILSALARQDLESLWLEKIEIGKRGNSISLEGRTLIPDDVPRFLRRLGREPSFVERRFHTFEMNGRDEEIPSIAFKMSTERRAVEETEKDG